MQWQKARARATALPRGVRARAGRNLLCRADRTPRRMGGPLRASRNAGRQAVLLGTKGDHQWSGAEPTGMGGDRTGRFHIRQAPEEEENTIRDVWESYLASIPNEERSVTGTLPRFADDREVLPLQAADMWAWSCRRTWLENDGMIPEDSYPVVLRCQTSAHPVPVSCGISLLIASHAFPSVRDIIYPRRRRRMGAPSHCTGNAI